MRIRNANSEEVQISQKHVKKITVNNCCMKEKLTKNNEIKFLCSYLSPVSGYL